MIWLQAAEIHLAINQSDMIIAIQVQDFFTSDLACGAGRASPWSLCILWLLFSWVVKPVTFNLSLVHKRVLQSNPDIQCAPESALQQQSLSGSVGVGGCQSTRETDKCVFSLHIRSFSLATKVAVMQLFATFLQLQSLLLVGKNGERGQIRQEWSGWWGLDGLVILLYAAGCGCQAGCS